MLPAISAFPPSLAVSRIALSAVSAFLPSLAAEKRELVQECTDYEARDAKARLLLSFQNQLLERNCP